MKPETAKNADFAGTVVRSGTGRGAFVGGQEGGKTGTTNDGRDLLFIGYEPSRHWVLGIWLGNDDNSPTASSSALAAGLWGDIIRPPVGAAARVVNARTRLLQGRGRFVALWLSELSSRESGRCLGSQLFPAGLAADASAAGGRGAPAVCSKWMALWQASSNGSQEWREPRRGGTASGCRQAASRSLTNIDQLPVGWLMMSAARAASGTGADRSGAPVETSCSLSSASVRRQNIPDPGAAAGDGR